MNFVKLHFYQDYTAISLKANIYKIAVAKLRMVCLMGQLKDFLRLGNTIGSFGIENGIVKYVSEYESEKLNLVILLEQF